MKLMLPTKNTDVGIGLYVCMKAERSEILTVAQGSLTLDWGQESSRSRSFLFLVLAMARKAVISGAPVGDWYGAHLMDRLG